MASKMSTLMVEN